MNKQISVQYAYKKDGKGERHGDDAERMLASQAKKNMTTPVVPSLPVQLFAQQQQQQAAPNAVTPVPNTAMYTNVRPPPPPMGFASGPPPTMGRPVAPPPAFAGGPPAGLPARPPPSQAGYGGPQNFIPPGFNGTPGGYAAAGPPPGFPPGF